jgi:hypothetical protein
MNERKPFVANEEVFLVNGSTAVVQQEYPDGQVKLLGYDTLVMADRLRHTTKCTVCRGEGIVPEPDALNQTIEEILKRNAQYLDMMAAAYLQQTGIPAAEVCLVRVDRSYGMVWYFARNSDVEGWDRCHEHHVEMRPCVVCGWRGI